MTFHVRFSTLVMSAALMLPLGIQAEEKTLDRADIFPIRDATRVLIYELEHLQEDIVSELSGRKELTLYTEADRLLAELAGFQQTVKAGATREPMFRTFVAVDLKLHELLRRVRVLGLEQRILQRSAQRVGNADEHLHSLLAITNEANHEGILARQIQALADASRRLDDAAHFALSQEPSQGVLVAEVEKFHEAIGRFQKALQGGAKREQLQQEFAQVNRAWKLAVRELREILPGKQTYLLRVAVQVDRIHESLFRLLGMEGECPRLQVRG